MNEQGEFALQCPIPRSEYEHVVMAHGGGGRLTRQLVEKVILSRLGNEFLDRDHDGAILPPRDGEMAMTTDSFVVDPIFFPGGDIGDLAVNGTVNDLLCCGAEPMYLSLSLILEEGLEIEELWRIILSIERASSAAGVKVVTGDTKVVERGKGDRIFINTTGIGNVVPGLRISPERCAPGDVVLINGSIGDHGIAILSARGGAGFGPGVKSDTFALNRMMKAVFTQCGEIHVLRDPTRGGVAGALNEICRASGTGILLDEHELPVKEGVRGACELLGLDPLYVANEGKMLVILPGEHAAGILSIMRDHAEGVDSRIIGRVTADHPGMVRMRTSIGTTRIIDMISGEQLPRIC